MSDPKVTDETPTRTPIKWLDDLFEWARKREWPSKATRKEFRYPDDTREDDQR